MNVRRMIRTAAIMVVVIVVPVSALFFALSRVNDYREPIAAWVSEAVGASVQVDEVRVLLVSLKPVIELFGVRVVPPGGSRGLRAERMDVGFDWFASLSDWRPRVSELHVSGTDFVVDTDADGNSRIAGLMPLLPGFSETTPGTTLSGLPDLSVRLEHAVVHWRNERAGADYRFEDVEAVFESSGGRLRFAGRVSLPETLGSFVHAAAEIETDSGSMPDQWTGRVYLRAEDADVAQWARLVAEADGLDVDGTFTAELWSDWHDGALRQLGGSFNCEDCAAARADPPVSVQTRLFWEARGDGWRLGLLDFGWESPGFSIANSDLAITHNRSTSRLVLRAPMLDANLLRSAPGAELLREAGVEIRRGLSAAAVLAKVSHRDFEAPARSETPAPGGARGLPGLLGDRFRSTARYVDHLVSSARVETLASSVTATDVVVKVSPWSDRVFDFDEVMATVLYTDGAYAVEDLSIRFGDTRLEGQFDWRGGGPESLALKLENLPLVSAREFLPREGLNPRLSAWLEQAFIGGVVKEARVEMDGALSSFPFKRGNGRFHAEAEVEDAALSYRADRKPLRDVDARVVFDNEKLLVEASDARYYGLRVRAARVLMRDITWPLVEVDAHASGPFAGAFAYLKDTRLINPDSAVIRGLQPGGDSRVDLSLKIPLSRKVGQPLAISGALHFDRTSLGVTPLGLELGDISGVLEFDRNGGSASRLSANLNGTSVTASARPVGDESPGETLLTVTGRLPVSRMFDLSRTPLGGKVRGTAPWRIDILVPGPRAVSDYELKMALTSTLEGMEVALPSPFGKAGSERRRFSARVMFGARNEYSLSYGEDLRVILVGSDVLNQPSGYLYFGRGEPPPVRQGRFRISGKVSQPVEIDDWLDSGNEGLVPDLDRLDLSFAELRKGGEVLGETSVRLAPVDGGRELRVDGPWARGSVFMPDAAGNTVLVRMERLFLPKGASTASDTMPDPATVPPLEVDVIDFRRGDLNVSSLSLVTEPAGSGMKIGRLAFEAAEVLLTVNGQWLFDGRDHRSDFQVEAHGRDYGSALESLGVLNSLKEGDGSVTGSIGWPGPPTGFAFENLEGRLSLGLADGVIEKADPGIIGRLFALSSVAHIVQRLSFDFRDVLDKGLSFDSLEGSLNFHDGVMSMENFVVSGPPLKMEIKGDNFISEQRYDQQIDVVPNLSSGLLVGGALLGGPITAAAFYLVDKLTGAGAKIDKAVTLRYRLHGSWEAPQVDFVEAPEVGKGAEKIRPKNLKKLLKKIAPDG